MNYPLLARRQRVESRFTAAFLVAVTCWSCGGEASSTLSTARQLEQELSDYHSAVAECDSAAVDLALDKVRARISSGSNAGLSFLLLADSFDCYAAFVRLLEAGVDPNALSIDGESIVARALFAPDERLLRTLLKYGADPNVTLSTARDPLIFGAVALEDLVLIDMLLDSGAGIDSTDGLGATPLLAALLARQYSIAKALLDRGADSSIADDSGTTPAEVIKAAMEEYPPSAPQQELLLELLARMGSSE